MNGEFVNFLIKRIGKKLGDITEAVDHDELVTHIDDIHDYLDQLTHLLTQFIHLVF
jgi:hypothetical protein